MVLKESELFDYLREFHWPDLRKAPSVYDAFDCISDSEKMFVELKSRNTHYDELLLEEPKYKALLSGAAELELTPWYINSTPDGIWGFNLGVMDEPVWEEKWLPRSTEFSRSGNKTKLVSFIHIDSGVAL